MYKVCNQTLPKEITDEHEYNQNIIIFIQCN